MRPSVHTHLRKKTIMSVEITNEFIGEGRQNNGLAVVIGLTIPGMEIFGRVVRVHHSTRYLLAETEKPCNIEKEYDADARPHHLTHRAADGSDLPSGTVRCYGCDFIAKAENLDGLWRPNIIFDKETGHLRGVAQPRVAGTTYLTGYDTEEAAKKIGDEMVAWQASRYADRGPYWFAVVDYADAGIKYEIFPDKNGIGYGKTLDFANEPFCEAYAGPYDDVYEALAALGRAEHAYPDLKSIPGIVYKGIDPKAYDIPEEDADESKTQS